MVVKKTIGWLVPTLSVLAGISLVFSTGIIFNQFQVDVMDFFVQAEKVETNEKRITNIEKQLKMLVDKDLRYNKEIYIDE